MQHPIMGFEHLHRHSDFSLLDGFAMVHEYAERMKEINQKYLCITDHGVMGAVPQQIDQSEKHNLFPLFGCLPAGAPIITKFGVKNIEDIKIGDLVLTHTGSYQKVIRTSARFYKGKMYEIKLSDSSKLTPGFRLTDEHPVLIRNILGERNFIRADEIIGGRPTTKRGIESWNSYVCFPRIEKMVRQADFIKLEEYLPDGKSYNNWEKLKGKEIIWSVHLARLLGLYTAEGSVRTNKDGSLQGVVTFSFSSEERESYVDETCDLLQKVFGIEAVVHDRPEKSLCEIIFGCLPVAYFLAELCGIGSHNKKVPIELRVRQNENLNEAYLSGLLDGDGKNPDVDINGQATMRTSSCDVAFGMKMLLADLGEWVNVTKREDDGKVCYNVPYSPRRSYARFLVDKEYVYKPIREVMCEYVECNVFNIEVEHDNSYVSDFIVHNCELYVNRMQPKSERRSDTAEFYRSLGDPNAEDKRNQTPEQKAFRKSNHLLAIAYNNIGYQNLVRLSSWAWIHGYYYRPRINHDALKQHKEGIIFTSGCGISEIASAFFDGGDEAGFQMLEHYLDMLGRDNFYLEMMMLDWKMQAPYNSFLIRAHEKYGLPMILSQDCFVKNTPVLTKNGFKNIEDIVVGDVVLSHKGKWRRVEVIGSRPIKLNEKVFRVKTRVGTYAYYATGDHEVYVGNRTETGWSKNWKKTESLTKEDYLLVPKMPLDLFASEDVKKIDLMPFLSDQEYQTGDEYRSNNKGNMGCCLQYNKESEEFWSYRGWDRKFKTTIPRYLTVDDELLEIIGWYIAEGWSEKKSNQVGFALHSDEQHIAEWIVSYFKKYGIMAKIYKVSDKGIAVRFSSVVFNAFFGKMCGLGASNKHLPHFSDQTWIGKWTQKQLLKILSCYWKGDGHGSNVITSFGTTSKHLIFEIASVFNALGMFVYPCVEKAQKTNHSDKWCITVCENKTNQIHEWFSGSISNFDDPRAKGTKYFELEDCYAIQTIDVSPVRYEDEVYCFQVEEDHTFTAGLYSVSNCHYCKKEHSHNQRLMLMQQNKRTIQEVQAMIDSGQADDLFELQDTNLWLKSEDELNAMWELKYKDIIDYDIFKQAKANTVAICEKAKGVEIDRDIKLPKIPDSNEILWEETLRGFLKRGCPKTKEYKARIREEYDLICEKGFSSYFLIQKQMTDEARQVGPKILGFGDGSEAVGPGRGCLKKDTPIDIGAGITVPICEVKKGQEVRTLDGSLKKVEKVWEYDLSDENLLNVKTYYGDAVGVSLTGDHEIYVEKQAHPDNCHNWSESTRKARKSFKEPKGDLSWIRADEISVGDWCFLPIPKVDIWNDFCIDLSNGNKSFKNGKKLRVDESFVYHEFNSKSKGRVVRVSERHWKLTKEWATVLGIFVGDGWTVGDGRSQVGFCSHTNEESFLEYVEDVFSNGFGCDFTWNRNHGNKQVTQMIVKSIYGHRLFQALHPCYHHTSDTKHVPSCILNAPEEIVLSYLKGYFWADGHEDDHKIKFQTTSPVLASQIRYLLLRVGIPSSLSYEDRDDKREEFSNSKLSYIINCPLFKKIGASRDFQKQYGWRSIDKGILLRIREITKEEGPDKVYDLQVSENHNYLTSSFLVHNSACGSLVAYCLRLHDVEPIINDLRFSRFLSPARGGKQMKIRHSLEPIPHEGIS